MKFFNGNNVFKIISVLMAVLLWLYVTNEQSPLDQSTREVALEIRNLPKNLAVREIPATVSVQIQGSRTLLANLSPADIDAYVDLARAHAGNNDVAVNVSLPAGIKKLKVTPLKARVLIDNLTERQVPVSVKITGNAAKGFSVLAPVVRPARVLIKGPRGLLETISKVEASITLQNQDRSFVTNLPVEAVNNQGQVLDTRLIRIVPVSVEVSFPIVKAEPRKTVPVEPRIIGALAKGYKVLSVVAVPAEVLVSGSAGKLETLNLLRTAPVDISGLSKDKVQDVELELPAGFSVPPYTKVKVIVKIGR